MLNYFFLSPIAGSDEEESVVFQQLSGGIYVAFAHQGAEILHQCNGIESSFVYDEIVLLHFVKTFRVAKHVHRLISPNKKKIII